MPSVRRAVTEARLARAETALGRSFFPSFARRSISSKIRESRTYAPVLIRFEMTSAGFSVIATSSLSRTVTTPVALGPLALRDEHGRFRGGGEEVLDETRVDHVAAIEDDERILEMPAGFPDRVGRSELFRLRDVGDVGSERLPVLEVRLDALPTVSDDEDEVPHAVLGEGLDDVLQEGPVPHGDQDLRDRGGEGTHPGALARGEDDGLHARCTCR